DRKLPRALASAPTSLSCQVCRSAVTVSSAPALSSPATFPTACSQSAIRRASCVPSADQTTRLDAHHTAEEPLPLEPRQMIPLANLSRQHAELAAPLHAAIDEVFARSAFISGPFVERFERAFSEQLGDPAIRTIGVSKGTAAISLVLE